MASQEIQNLWASASKVLGRQPKKAAGLGALIIIMALMWARAMSGGPSPAVARANVIHKSGGATADSQGFTPRPRAESSLLALRLFCRRNVLPLSRNLFCVNTDVFPGDAVKTLEAPAGDGFWDSIAKSMRAKAEEKDRRRKVVEQACLEAAQLKLQSTIMGSSPKAMIDGRLVGLNDLVGGGKGVAPFKVVRIGARGIVVERDSVRLEIKFN
jgi:hypothetical protein